MPRAPQGSAKPRGLREKSFGPTERWAEVEPRRAGQYLGGSSLIKGWERHGAAARVARKGEALAGGALCVPDARAAYEGNRPYEGELRGRRRRRPGLSSPCRLNTAFLPRGLLARKASRPYFVRPRHRQTVCGAVFKEICSRVLENLPVFRCRASRGKEQKASVHAVRLGPSRSALLRPLALT